MKTCSQCEQIASNQIKTRNEKEKDDWRDVYRMHLFYQHHNPSIFAGDVQKYEVPTVPEENKAK